MNTRRVTYRLCTVIVFFSISCSNNTEHRSGEIKNSTDTTVFYPLNDYLIQQIKSVDSSADFIYKITIQDGHKDSTRITENEFNEWAKKFVEFNIADPSIKKFYTQDIFLDQATNSYTFSYKCTRNDLPLQSADILLDTATQQVKRIFMSRNGVTPDSSVTEKMGWKNNCNFFINSIIQFARRKETVQQNIIVWHYKV